MLVVSAPARAYAFLHSSGFRGLWGGANNDICNSNSSIQASMLTLEYLSSPQLCVAGSPAKSHKTCEILVRIGTTSEGGGMSKMKACGNSVVASSFNL